MRITPRRLHAFADVTHLLILSKQSNRTTDGPQHQLPPRLSRALATTGGPRPLLRLLSRPPVTMGGPRPLLRLLSRSPVMTAGPSRLPLQHLQTVLPPAPAPENLERALEAQAPALAPARENLGRAVGAQVPVQGNLARAAARPVENQASPHRLLMITLIALDIGCT